MAGFTQLLKLVASSTGKAQEVWHELQASLARVGRLEELVSWWRFVQPQGIGGAG